MNIPQKIAWTDDLIHDKLCDAVMSLNTEEIFDLLGVVYDRYNSDWPYKCICIFHKDGNEENASLCFDRENTYHCFACNAHGDILDLAAVIYSSPREIVAEFIAAQFGLTDEQIDSFGLEAGKRNEHIRLYAETNKVIYSISILLRDHLKKYAGTDAYNDETKWVDMAISKVDNKMNTLDRVETAKFNEIYNKLFNALSKRKAA